METALRAAFRNRIFQQIPYFINKQGLRVRFYLVRMVIRVNLPLFNGTIHYLNHKLPL